MDPLLDANTALTATLWLLLLLLNAEAFVSLPPLLPNQAENDERTSALMELEDGSACDTAFLMRMMLQNFRMCASLNVYHDEIMYWVKPRSTTWFSKFLLDQYDQTRWISMFRMTKAAVFTLAEVIRPQVQKKNTRYRLAIPVVVRVACALFKLCHGVNLTICSEMFAIGKSTVSKVLREVVHSINDCLKHEIAWPQGERLRITQRKFASLCSLPGVVGALDGVHISIAKPTHSPADYYYFKTGGYSMNCQAIVDSEKRFIDLCVGMPGSTNDSRVLRRSTLFHLATHNSLFLPNAPVDGFSPYLIADSAYPLLPWLVTPHRENAHLSRAEALLNQKLKKGRVVVENAFGIMKQTFRELLCKSDLHLTFLPDVVVCCAILHNILLRQSHEDVEELFHVLDEEGMPEEDEERFRAPRGLPRRDRRDRLDRHRGAGAAKRTALGAYLARRLNRHRPL